MQVFDENGKFLDIWPLKSPHWPPVSPHFLNHFIDDKAHLGRRCAHDRILKFDLNGIFCTAGAPVAKLVG